MKVGRRRPMRLAMKLTIINQFYKPDLAPTASLAASVAEHRARMGDQVTIIAGKGGYAGNDTPQGDTRAFADNPRVRRVWTPGLGKSNNLKRVVDYAAFYAFAMGRLATMPRQDLIISLTTPPIIPWAAVLHKRLHRRTKVVLWNMDCYPDLAERGGVIRTGGPVSTLAHALNRGIYRRLDHLVCLDTAMADLLCRHYTRVNPRLPVTIIPNWEEAAYFPPDSDPPAWARGAELGLDGRFVIVYLGNMGYGHGFETVLDAAEMLRDEPVRFLFVAAGRRWEDVNAEKTHRGLDNVVMHGYVPKDQTPSVMASSDAALVTLRDEILGIMSPSKIHANLAAGLPLIYVGPATSNVDEAIASHGCGISLRHGQADELAGFVRRLVRDEPFRAELRASARRAFDASYCDRATLPLFDAVIEHAMSGRTADQRVPAGAAEDYGGPRADAASERHREAAA